jgi:hypothetical protein
VLKNNLATIFHSLRKSGRILLIKETVLKTKQTFEIGFIGYKAAVLPLITALLSTLH